MPIKLNPLCDVVFYFHFRVRVFCGVRVSFLFELVYRWVSFNNKGDKLSYVKLACINTQTKFEFSNIRAYLI